MIASIRACPSGQSLRLTRIRPFLSLPGRSLTSSERDILSHLRANNFDKWGWVIYRCTYNDDEAWSRFKNVVSHQAHELIAESDTPEIADSLEWTFIENRDTLENASKDQLRARFNAWAAEAADVENPRRIKHPYGLYGILRYNYFVHVDHDALRSVAYNAPQPPELALDCSGYVNFVKANWVPMSQILLAAGHSLEDDGETYEPIEGCSEEDVGWMRLASINLTAGFYHSMLGWDDIWYT